MPTPNKEESKDEFMKRCIPYIINEGKTNDRKQAYAICNGIWEEKDRKPGGADKDGGGTTGREDSYTRELYMLDADCDHAISFITEPQIELKNEEKDLNRFNAVAVVGDKFYKGKFLPYHELEKAYKTMDGAYHDINHWGTNYPIDGHPNIEYIIGYQKNTSVNPLNKTMRTDIIVNPDAPKYMVWKNFIDINKQAGRMPNVSVSFWATTKDVKAGELPQGVDYSSEGYSKDDDVEYLYDLGFQALSTVFKGACDDKQGCGIGMHHDTTPITDTSSCIDEELLRLQLKNKQMRLLKEEKNI